jgi:uncharacterized membrane protein YraQ (UPF0718 family)
LALLAFLSSTRDGHSLHAFARFSDTLQALVYESAPALLLAYFAAGLVHVWLPSGSLGWLNRGSRLRQGVAGMAVGLPLPICSCGVVPLYRQLVQQGVAPTAALAFLVATPELGLDAVLLSVPLLGGSMAAIRLGAAVVAALAVALIMGARIRRVRGLPQQMANSASPVSLGARLSRVVQVGLVEMVDHTAPWIVAGLLVAAAAAPVLEGSWLTTLPPLLDVLVFAAIGLPLYVCASASTPIVAALVAAGVSPGAGLALLLTGPATNVGTLGILSKMHGRAFAWGFASVMIGSAVLLGWAVNAAFPTLSASQPALSAAEGGRWYEQMAAALLVLLFGASLLRRGVRGFCGELRLSGAAG